MDNKQFEQFEDIVFGVRYSLQQLEERLIQDEQKKEKTYFDILEKFDNNIKVILKTMQTIQQDILQLRLATNSSSNIKQPILSPKTQVVASPEEALAIKERTSQTKIKWDERASDIAPEESFGFKIPNK